MSHRGLIELRQASTPSQGTSLNLYILPTTDHDEYDISDMFQTHLDRNSAKKRLWFVFGLCTL